jgi:vacuolar-type H+-ATPase subunit I/STV1
MGKGKRKNLTNRNQDQSPSSEPSTPSSASPAYPNTPEKLDPELKAYLMMMVEDIKKDFNNSLKEIQENTAKEVEVLKQKQDNTTKKVMEMNKTIQDLKREVDTIKKTQSETTVTIETIGKKSGIIGVSISNRIQGIEERISGAEDSIENEGTTIKENGKCKKILTQNIQEIEDTMRRQNLRLLGVDENEDFQIKGPAHIFNKIIEENFPNLKKEMPMNIKEAYRTLNRLDQKRNSFRHTIIRRTNALKKDRILKAVREKGQVTYKGRPIRHTPDISPETIKARRTWTGAVSSVRRDKNNTDTKVGSRSNFFTCGFFSYSSLSQQLLLPPSSLQLYLQQLHLQQFLLQQLAST